MKLLFCDNTSWGMINFRGGILDHFHQCGHEIVLISPTDETTELKTELPHYVRFIPIKLNRAAQNPLGDLLYLLRLIAIYQKERPDWIFHYTIKPNIYGSIAAKITGIKSVAMIAGLGYIFSQKRLLSSLAKRLYRFALQFAVKVFVLNTDNLNTLLTEKFVQEDKLILLESGEGIDTKKILPSPPQSTKIAPTFLMVARAIYDKGYKEFVEAAASLKKEGINAEFGLLGPIDESYPTAVSRTTIDKDVKAGYIQHLGFSKNPLDIMSRQGVVIVLPSYHEGMNRSLMEACALGKPIITTDIPGCREIVEDGKNGFLVPVRDSQALAKAMRRYTELELSQQNDMGHHSRRLAEEKFDIKNVIKEYERLLSNSF